MNTTIYRDDKGFLIAGWYWKDMDHAIRARELIVKQQDGLIDGLRFFVKVKLSEADYPYVADYTYTENGRLIYEDLKTEKDSRFKDVVRLWKIYGNGILRSTRRIDGITIKRNEYQSEDIGNV